ncbi:hypothetical protein ACFYZ2_40720 [Streptomyces sviceus]|uniref:hypothetical protein n=1 Tax=Streptomyces sviceus TaxID=285530 RepID=UPI0036B1DAC4
MMSSQELTLVCSELGTRDYLSGEIMTKQFRDVSQWLWKKYPEQISGWLRRGLTNLETPDKDRAPLRFDYSDEAGNLLPIDSAEDVSAIAKMSPQVQWHPQVVGGANFRQTFGMHAAEILTNPKYKNWRCVVPGKPGYGIQAVGPDPQGIIRTWTVKPSADYPLSPPTVVSQPAYKDDICWRDGTLHYTRYAHGIGSPWNDVAVRSVNPLFVLLTELLQKYKLAV